MNLGKPIKAADGVFQIRVLGARVTVLVEKSEAILVDAGLWGSQGLILDGLGSLGLNPENLRMVVITHAHPDHSGGLAGLVGDTGIPVGSHMRWPATRPEEWCEEFQPHSEYTD